MFRDKKHIFFDLDHTLWDYERCSRETLSELWSKYELSDRGIDLENFQFKFREVNEGLWDKFHEGIIDKNHIRRERFPLILKSFGYSEGIEINEMQEAYINQCPTKPYLMDGTIELLDHLHGSYGLHIITNGFDDIQGVKLQSSGIINYFDHIVTSGSAGSQKPELAIFTHALNKAETVAEDSLMVGDNPTSDIHGAYLAGIDQVYFNPFNSSCPVIPTFEVASLRELIKVL